MTESYNVISVNGKYTNAENYKVDLSSRAFRYGDGFFETMHANGQVVQFLDDHFERMQKAANILQIKLPDHFTLPYLENHIAGLLHRCRLYQGTKVRVLVSRKSGGLFIPQNNEAEILIECEFLGKGSYELNKDGIVVGEYFCNSNYSSDVSAFKSLNSLPYVLAGLHAKNNNFDDVLVVNKQGYIIEATSSNFFCIKNKVIFSPDLKLGAVHGIMRKNVISIANNMGFEVKFDAKLTLENIIDMDEMFLTNAVVGIKWIGGFKNRRYFKRYSTKIIKKINDQNFSSFRG